jgi:hypothetical protein
LKETPLKTERENISSGRRLVVLTFPPEIKRFIMNPNVVTLHTTEMFEIQNSN